MWEGRKIEAELAEKLEGAFDDLDLGKANSLFSPFFPLSLSLSQPAADEDRVKADLAKKLEGAFDDLDLGKAISLFHYLSLSLSLSLSLPAADEDRIEADLAKKLTV